jgi:cyclophilin family peptidyl-prolyl cis-trans isomerase
MLHAICRPVLLIALLALAGLAGCSRSEPEPAVAAPEKPAPKAPKADRPEPVAGAKPVAAQPVSRQKLQKPFKQAVLLDPPEGQQKPPDLTVAGKNTALIFEAIAGRNYEGGLWDQVEYFDAEGRRLKYTALLRTELGEIEVALLPEVAPQQVTSFIALARAGYYDGLTFHASQRVEAGDKTLAYLEAGCPKGLGETGYGSVGYWLEPEIDANLVHDAGTVGAWHFAEDPDTAACRFYITLHRAPWMDGAYTIFGKVTRGLDVAEAVNKRPVVDEYPFDRPQQPVVIRQVLIQSKAAE